VLDDSSVYHAQPEVPWLEKGKSGSFKWVTRQQEMLTLWLNSGDFKLNFFHTINPKIKKWTD
jgi:hypothetical protein